MKKKKGFTLAEVLITLSIIGVVSALTLPSLTSGYKSQQIGVSLSKAINTLENANLMALQTSGVSDLTLIPANTTQPYSESIRNTSKIVTRNTSNADYNKYKIHGGSSLSTLDRPSSAFDTKDGMTYLQPTNGAPATTDNGSSRDLPDYYSGKAYKVYVDIDGNAKGPNTLGRDLFELRIDSRGTVIPYGGMAWQDYYSGSGIPLWQTSGDNACNSTSIGKGYTCAGAIVDNGYSVNYF